MNNRYKDKLVGVYAPGNYGHTSVLDQTQEFSRWFWSNRKDNDAINELHRLRGVKYRNARKYKVEMVEVNG